jgi:hypothetical protein
MTLRITTNSNYGHYDIIANVVMSVIGFVYWAGMEQILQAPAL